MADNPNVLTIDECAEIMRISRKLCYQMAKDGRLPAIKCGRRVLVSRVRLMQLIEGGLPEQHAA